MSAQQADPFRERRGSPRRRTIRALGCDWRVAYDDPALLALAESALGGLPRLERAARAPVLDLEIRSAPDDGLMRGRAPPPVRMSSGAGWLCGVIDAGNYALVDHAQRSALVSISPRMARFAYHARYELIEFAVFTLLARSLALVPLHAACFGWRGRAVLVLGDSGAGKSTLCLQALREGFEFLSEDSVFVAPNTLVAAGLPTFLHLRDDALHFVAGDPLFEVIRRSPYIRRRSGARKREIDLRRAPVRLAGGLQRVVAVVVLNAASARGQRPLTPMAAARLARSLAATQPYAAGQPGWMQFRQRIARVPAFELRRAPPAQGLRELRKLLGRGA
jgi:hypothetical protein